MSRNHILVIGALLWAAVAVDAFAHIVTGDWIAPAIAGMAGVAWVTVRRVRRGLPEAA